MKKMKAIAVLILVLIVSSFAKDPCTDARELFLKSIPNQETTTCHVIGVVPDRRDLMGFFIEMVDGSRSILVYEENGDNPTMFAEADFILRPRCIEDDGKFDRRYMTSEQITDKLLRFSGCEDTNKK
jgi:hypothetical protein